MHRLSHFWKNQDGKLYGDLGLIDKETAMMVYKSINNEAPEYLTSLFERLSQNTIRELRNTKTDLKLPLLKPSSDRDSFSYRGARICNNLSAYAKSRKLKLNSKSLQKPVEILSLTL